MSNFVIKEIFKICIYEDGDSSMIVLEPNVEQEQLIYEQQNHYEACGSKR